MKKAFIPLIIALSIASRTEGANSSLPSLLSGPGSVASTVGASAGDLTGAAIGAFVNELVQKLNNVAATMAGDASITLNGQAASLSALLAQLNKALQDNINTPLHQLNYQIQDAGIRLYNAALQIDSMLTAQQDRLYDQIGVLIAGVQTSVLEAKEGFLLSKEGEPRVFYFLFDQSRTPSIVPVNGGRLVVHGIDYGKENNLRWWSW